MQLTRQDQERTIRKIVVATLSFMIAWGFVLVLAQIKPFWVDEWRVIYNLKYKSPAALFGQLDFMQQFPRVYLAIIKVFTFPFDYSYFTLRLPAYLVGVAAILICYRLMARIYGADNLNRFLFVMILVSSYTFTEYFVQIKQYTMDILLSLVAIYQLLELLAINSSNLNRKRYALLCASFLVVPFFSYTYPIAIAPVFIVVFLQNAFAAGRQSKRVFRKHLLLCWQPLCICAASVALFYIVDVSQVVADKGMQQFWGHLMMKNGFSLKLLLLNTYELFAQVGRGLLFSTIFGILGVASFLFGCYKSKTIVFSGKQTVADWLIIYSSLVLLITIALFLIGKFPLGEPRLNVFTVPSISVLIICFIGWLQQRASYQKFARALPLILYAGVIGHVYTTFLSNVTGPTYSKKLNIYVATENAIILAQAKKLPIFITPEVAFPYNKTINLPFTNTVPGDWVLKTFPAYKVQENTPVYALASMSDVKSLMQHLPPGVNSVLAGDGRSFQIVNR